MFAGIVGEALVKSQILSHAENIPRIEAKFLEGM